MTVQSVCICLCTFARQIWKNYFPLPSNYPWGLCGPRNILTRAQEVNIGISEASFVSYTFVFGVRTDPDGSILVKCKFMFSIVWGLNGSFLRTFIALDSVAYILQYVGCFYGYAKVSDTVYADIGTIRILKPVCDITCYFFHQDDGFCLSIRNSIGISTVEKEQGKGGCFIRVSWKPFFSTD